MKKNVLFILAWMLLCGVSMTGSSTRMHSTEIMTTISVKADPPSKFHKPFSDVSPFNTKIPLDATYSNLPDIWDTITIGLASAGNNQRTAVVLAKTSDPLMEIIYHSSANTNIANGIWLRNRNSAEIETLIISGASSAFASAQGNFPCNFYSTQTEGVSWFNTGGCPNVSDYDELTQSQLPSAATARVPADFTSGNGTDALASIKQPDGSWLDCIHTIVLPINNKIICEMYSFIAEASDGAGARNGRRASMIPAYAGLIRKQEAINGQINHALIASAPRTLLNEAFVFPALAFDAGSNLYTGTIAMGTRLAIPRSIDLETLCAEGICLNKSSVAMMLSRTLQEYGVFIGDNNGTATGFTLHTEENMTNTGMEIFSEIIDNRLNGMIKNSMKQLRNN